MAKKILLMLVMLAAAGCMGIFGEPDIKVSYPTATYSPMIDDAVSIFMFIENIGSGDDYLISVRVVEYPDKKVELHDVVDGRMTMIEKLKIPGDEIVELRGGSYHIMVFDVTEPLGEVTLVLNFEKTGEVEVKVEMPREK